MKNTDSSFRKDYFDFKAIKYRDGTYGFYGICRHYPDRMLDFTIEGLIHVGDCVAVNGKSEHKKSYLIEHGLVENELVQAYFTDEYVEYYPIGIKGWQLISRYERAKN